MLENSAISKSTFELEKTGASLTSSKSLFMMQDTLGQFLRFTHFILIAFLNEGVLIAN